MPLWKVLFVARSILAGCTSSTRMSRAITKQPLADAEDKAKARGHADDYTAGVHVDDIGQTSEAATPAQAADLAIAVGDALVDAALDLGLVMSPKSVVLSPSAEARKRVVAHFRGRGILLSGARAAEDLGAGADQAQHGPGKDAN